MLRLPSFTTPFVGQYTRISPVCFVWHPAASQQPQPPAVLLPMLAATASPPLPIRAWTASLPPPPTPSPPFLRPFGQGLCYLEGFPEDAGGARLCGSFPGGWVAFQLNNWRGHCLVNVSTGDRISLPDLVRSPAPGHDCVVAIKSMVLSAAPTSDGAYMVADFGTLKHFILEAWCGAMVATNTCGGKWCRLGSLEDILASGPCD